VGKQTARDSVLLRRNVAFMIDMERSVNYTGILLVYLFYHRKD